MFAALTGFIASSPLAGAGRASATAGSIAFARADGIYLMRADGSGVHRLRRLAAAPEQLAWSPDGSKLAFVTPAHGNAIWAMDGDGRNLVRLVTRAGNVMSPSWSPDGSRIAFTAYRDGGRDIWLMNADGSRQRRLATTPRLAEIEVDWSAATGRIVFSTLDAYIAHLYVIDVNGRNRRDLTPGKFEGIEPAWSPDGRRIAFTRWRGSDASAEIYAVNADGTGRVRLTHNHDGDREPSWSPDGRRIALVRGTAGNASPEIYVTNIDGSGTTRLTHTPATADWSPAWRPTGGPIQ